MKLQFAENLRRLRHGQSLTQEQLAEKLGVSFQTVSRWETGAVYPDIELLPMLSELFDVTVDELIGCDSARREERLNAAWDKYNTIADPEEAYQHLKRMRSEFKGEWEIAVTMLQIIRNDQIHLDEMREIALDILNKSTSHSCRSIALSFYVEMEEEKYITDEFLDKYTSSWHDKVKLLKKRYFYQGEWDKYDFQRKQVLLYQLRSMFEEGLRMKYHSSPENSIWAQKTGLDIINTLCDIKPAHRVSGDGTVDLWTFERVHMGLRLSCALASSGDKEGAFAALEDTVELVEKFVAIPDGTELTFRSQTFGDAKAKLKWERTRTAKKEWVSAELDVYDEGKLLSF